MSIKVINRIIIALLAVLLVVIVIFIMGFTGNPISKMYAKQSVEKYIEENYRGKNFVINRIEYNFIDGCYYAHISSPSGIDIRFDITVNKTNEIEDDYYRERVLSGRNTAQRINDEYLNLVDKIFESPDFPYDSHIEHGMIVFAAYDYFPENIPDYAIPEQLIPNKNYDVKEFGRKAGKIILEIYDEKVSSERMAEILLDIRKRFDDAEIPFYAVNCILEQPKRYDLAPLGNQIEVRDFLYTDIYEEGLTERISHSNEKTD